VTNFHDITCQVQNAGIPLQKFLPKTVFAHEKYSISINIRSCSAAQFVFLETQKRKEKRFKESEIDFKYFDKNVQN
jgi:hypothetical protein